MGFMGWQYVQALDIFDALLGDVALNHYISHSKKVVSIYCKVASNGAWTNFCGKINPLHL